MATFTDAYSGQVASDLTATINWGDGTSSVGVISGGGGNFAVDGSHTYTTGGLYTTTVTVADDPPGTAIASGSSHQHDQSCRHGDSHVGRRGRGAAK